jgi:Acetylglutamate kinase
MALTGKTNPRLVALIQQQGGRAVGLSGKDGNLIRARKLQAEVDLGFVGEVEQINPEVVLNALAGGYIPVISPVGLGADGRDLQPERRLRRRRTRRRTEGGEVHPDDRMCRAC